MTRVGLVACDFLIDFENVRDLEFSGGFLYIHFNLQHCQRQSQVLIFIQEEVLSPMLFSILHESSSLNQYTFTSFICILQIRGVILSSNNVGPFRNRLTTSLLLGTVDVTVVVVDRSMVPPLPHLDPISIDSLKHI